jgi:Mrp family chromosome partitioning ATPase
MERIQLAITKARDARKTRPDASAKPAPDEAPLRPDLQTAVEAADAAWAALMEFRPDARHLERARVVATGAGAAAGPFDSLRTRLLYLMRDKGWKRVAVTSPGPGCGKTTVCLNLALSLARLPDVRTLLIDADLRRPATAKTLGTTARHQFAEALAGQAEPARHLLRLGHNLAIGTNHRAVANSAELLQSPQAMEALDRIEAEYQPTLMLFDLPPLLVSDDTMAAMGLMDCVLIVAAAETTTVAEIDRCERELASRTNVVGVVLNKCRYLDKSEGYGYGYY